MTYSNQRQGGLIMLTDRFITKQTMDRFYEYLIEEERSSGTIEKYIRDVRLLQSWLGSDPVTKENAARWKQELLQSGRAPSTVNSMLAAANTYFRFMGWDELKLKSIRLQRRFFRENERELTKAEYQLLMETAKKRGDERLALLMETICATGIRVSEVPYITTDAIKKGRARISMKGKLRTILIPAQLCRKLRKYATKHRIGRGEIFLTKNGTRLERKQIWAQMKTLCKYAGIERNKVFPHNLRHLFARCFYRISHDISSLADVLGHSSIETTRIYLISTESEHIKK